MSVKLHARSLIAGGTLFLIVAVLALVLTARDGSAQIIEEPCPDGLAQFGKNKRDFPKAVDEFTHCLETLDLSKDERGYLHYRRGQAQHYSGEHEQALQDFDQAITYLPNEPLLYVLRGAERVDLGDVDGGLAEFETAFAMEGSFLWWHLYPINLYFHAANALYRNNTHLDLAFAYAEDAEWMGDEVRVRIHMDQGRNEEAIAVYEQAMSDGGYSKVNRYKRALRELGYDPGELDGDYGPKMQVVLRECVENGCILYDIDP